MKALVFGSINIDMIYSVDHIVAPGETISSAALTKSAGGKGANQAAALAKAGMAVSLAGKIGEDGGFLLELLQSYGIDTSRIIPSSGSTGQALIQLDKYKQNSIIVYPGANAAISSAEIVETLDRFEPGDLILVQNEIARIDEIIREAARRKLKICLNPSPYNEGVEALPLALADCIFVNEQEGAALTALPPDRPLREILEVLVDRFPRAEILLTAGKQGAWYGYQDIRHWAGIVDVPVVDTVGAGDTFTGYFISARQKNYPVSRSLELACKAASLTVSRQGAMEAIPLAAEVFPAENML